MKFKYVGIRQTGCNFLETNKEIESIRNIHNSIRSHSHMP